MRIIYFGREDFAVPTLMSLMNSDHKVLCVVTLSKAAVRPNPVEIEANKFDLPIYDYKASDITRKIRRLKADIGIVADLGEELPNSLRSAFPCGCIKIHPSLLPKYRGASPITWAILGGETKTGVSVFRITDKEYAGPIFVQRETMIRPDEIWTELHFRLARIACDAVRETLNRLSMDPGFAGEEQNEQEATIAPELKESEGYLHFDEPAEAIALRCRAMWPIPGTLCRYISRNGEVEHLQIIRAIAEQGSFQLPPGTITTEFKVATAEGLLQIQELQPAKSRVSTWQDFTRERNVSPGERLEAIPV
jgi:methionyl-tRNA formyltransferase